jgi:hypothetical protein
MEKINIKRIVFLSVCASLLYGAPSVYAAQECGITVNNNTGHKFTNGIIRVSPTDTPNQNLVELHVTGLESGHNVRRTFVCQEQTKNYRVAVETLYSERVFGNGHSYCRLILNGETIFNLSSTTGGSLLLDTTGGGGSCRIEL